VQVPSRQEVARRARPPMGARDEQHTLHATLAAPRALDFIRRSRPARVLHVFPDIINLADPEGEILSLILDPDQMNPISAALERPGWMDGFLDYVDADCRVHVAPDVVALGPLRVVIGQPAVWTSRPEWMHIRSAPAHLMKSLDRVRLLLLDQAAAESLAVFTRDQPDGRLGEGQWWARAVEPVQVILEGIETQDLHLLEDGAARLAGLGPGLTPAGDDFLIGLMHAIWSASEDAPAECLCAGIASAAVPRTSIFSAAYLKSAAGGEAPAHWQALLRACAEPESAGLKSAVGALLEHGHTSGQDALSGFVLGARRLLAPRA
jgi:hypothetical protein